MAIDFDKLIGRQIVVRGDGGALVYPFTAVSNITVDATQPWTEGFKIVSILGHFDDTSYVVTVEPDELIELVGSNSLIT